MMIMSMNPVITDYVRWPLIYFSSNSYIPMSFNVINFENNISYSIKSGQSKIGM